MFYEIHMVFTSRHGHMAKCKDCIAFAESLNDALPYLDPAVFKNIKNKQKSKVSVTSKISTFLLNLIQI